MHHEPFAERWERPFTAKRYLHPPFAERMLTMWPDLRVISGDVVEQTGGYLSGGYRILVGEALLPPDFTAVQYHVRPDGVPLHAITHKLGLCTR